MNYKEHLKNKRNVQHQTEQKQKIFLGFLDFIFSEQHPLQQYLVENACKNKKKNFWDFNIKPGCSFFFFLFCSVESEEQKHLVSLVRVWQQRPTTQFL